ncbi:MAG TPA: protein translocase subunit SecD, partial [Halieaceae bacterium]|nr:protein translocase subunit SecD [Halieaceae bacterium]
MLNRYSLWQNLLILWVILVGFFYAAPNLYAPDPAVQITSASSGQVIDAATLNRALLALEEAEVEHFGEEISANGRNALIRLRSADKQLIGQARIARALGDGYIVALNLAPTTPEWLSNWGATPMKLGLDLSGGVHFKLEVDAEAALERRYEFYLSSVKKVLRENRVRGLVELTESGVVMAKLGTAEERELARQAIADEMPELVLDRVDNEEGFAVTASMTEQAKAELIDYAVAQNLTTLRNRVNELGVSEPLVQRQGRNRIVVELPGIQDTAEAKRILGKVANLEFRLVAASDASPSERQRFEYRGDDRQGMSEWLERGLIITGERVANAAAGFDQNGRPNVSISLDGEGGTLMSRATRNNVKRRMGVLFIERKFKTR